MNTTHSESFEHCFVGKNIRKMSPSDVHDIQKAKHRQFFTVELPIFLVMFGMSLSGAITTNILLYRTCIHTLSYPHEECLLLLTSETTKSNDTIRLQNEAQQYASYVRMVHSMVEAIIPAILSLFLGTWSNIYGRKPLILWPSLGMCLSALMAVGYARLDGLGPWWFLLTAIPFTLTGGSSTIFTGAFCYVADISSEKQRSFRIAILEASLYSGIIFGSLCAPFLLSRVGIFSLLSITSAAYGISFIYTLLLVEESVKGAAKGNVSSVLDLSLVREMLKACVRKRPNKDRTIIFLLVLCSTFCAYHGSDLEYMYTRNKLQWSFTSYSIFAAVNTLTLITGLIIGVTLMQRVWKISDIYLAMLSYMSTFADFVVKAFALATWHMYLGSCISVFRGLGVPLIKSILSKILPVEDIAKIFSLISILNSFFPLVAPLVFNSLYSATINVFSGAIYILWAGIFAVNFTMLCIVKYYMWKYPQEEKTKKLELIC